MYIYISLYIYIPYIYISYLYICVCIYIYIKVCIYANERLSTHVSIHICIYVYTHICIYVFMFVYVGFPISYLPQVFTHDAQLILLGLSRLTSDMTVNASVSKWSGNCEMPILIKHLDNERVCSSSLMPVLHQELPGREKHCI